MRRKEEDLQYRKGTEKYNEQNVDGNTSHGCSTWHAQVLGHSWAVLHTVRYEKSRILTIRFASELSNVTQNSGCLRLVRRDGIVTKKEVFRSF